MQNTSLTEHRYYGTVHSVWTNIFYVISGIIAILLTGVHGLAAGLGLIGLGYGSYVYHKKLYQEFAAWDWFGMYAAVLSIIGYLWYLEGVTLIWMWVFIGYMASWILFNHMNRFLILVILCVLLFSSAINILPYSQILYILCAFAPALALRLGVEPRLKDDETKAIDIVHSLWHLFTAIGFTLFFI